MPASADNPDYSGFSRVDAMLGSIIFTRCRSDFEHQTGRRSHFVSTGSSNKVYGQLAVMKCEATHLDGELKSALKQKLRPRRLSLLPVSPNLFSL
jgi:hypothetical protein